MTLQLDIPTELWVSMFMIVDTFEVINFAEVPLFAAGPTAKLG